jgi:hypothetical protein
MVGWIVHKIFFWGVMITTFGFTVANANGAMDGFVSVAIQIQSKAVNGFTCWASLASGFSFVFLKIVHNW